MAAVVLRNAHGEILIEKRPDKGLLAGLWQFPTIETESLSMQLQELEQALEPTIGALRMSAQPVQTVEHVFSHVIWNITVYEGETESIAKLATNQKWVTKEKKWNIMHFPYPIKK